MSLSASAARELLRVADTLERRGDDEFRVGAYRKAARSIEQVDADLRELATQGKLKSIPGVGPNLAAKLCEFLDTGTMATPPPHPKQPGRR